MYLVCIIIVTRAETKQKLINFAMGKRKFKNGRSDETPFCVVCNGRRAHSLDIPRPPQNTGSKRASPYVVGRRMANTSQEERGLGQVTADDCG